MRTSWAEQLGALIALLTGAQTTAARQTGPWLSRALGAGDEQLVPEAFAGHASDGRPLPGLLMYPLWATLAAIGRGLGLTDALASGATFLDLLVHTQVADAGRAADSVGMTIRDEIRGYERVVELSACSRCIVLAGRLYRWSDGFLRHPRCFPAGVVVSGPSARAATRRRYEGELVIITTAGGQELPVTGNHPVLTDHGWVPANRIQEGDQVVRSVLGQGAAPLVVPNERQVPALIEDLWRPDGVVPFRRMPTTAEDFHGDGGHGEVDVVFADGFLGNGFVPAVRKPLSEHALSLGVEDSAFLTGAGSALEKLQGLFGSAHGGVGSGGLGSALLGGHLCGTGFPGAAAVAPFGPGFIEATCDNGAGHSVSGGETVLALAREVGGHDVLGGQWSASSPRWDAPGVYGSEEGRLAYAGRGADLGRRLAGQVELDRVVDFRRVRFSGHVYNLSSSEGWYSANGLIVSNCDCTMEPVTYDEWVNERPGNNPAALFEQMTPEQQEKAFTAADLQAIRDGADLGQVVNARRGMQTATAYGQQVAATTEGTTVRALYGGYERREDGTLRRRADSELERRRGQRYRTAKAPRLMPEEIYARADDREHAIRLLRKYGYLR